MIELNAKLATAIEAVKLVQNGQVVGLGSGSTAEFAIKALGKRASDEGLDLIGIPTSERSAEIGKESGIPISTLDEHDVVDITIDGADEVDPNLDLIKGLGGALLREKIVAKASRQEVIVVDDSKLVYQLGTKSPLPVEIVQFSRAHVDRKISALGCSTRLRLTDSGPFVTDNGNYILDCRFKSISAPIELESKLHAITGVVETGLFIGIADTVIVGSSSGVRTMRRRAREE